jgi:hypothetical protein
MKPTDVFKKFFIRWVVSIRWAHRSVEKHDLLKGPTDK